MFSIILMLLMLVILCVIIFCFYRGINDIQNATKFFIGATFGVVLELLLITFFTIAVLNACCVSDKGDDLDREAQMLKIANKYKERTDKRKMNLEDVLHVDSSHIKVEDASSKERDIMIVEKINEK